MVIQLYVAEKFRNYSVMLSDETGFDDRKKVVDPSIGIRAPYNIVLQF